MAKGTTNKVFLLGNLGADPEMRATASGMSVATLRVATTDSRKVQDRWEDHTEWHTVIVWGKAAEFLRDYGAKGRKVMVEGRLQTRKWQDKQGQDRYSTEIVASEVQLVDRGSDESKAKTPAPASSQAPSSSAPAADVPDFDDDIPF